jgi:GT2 family glycosyltransferase
VSRMCLTSLVEHSLRSARFLAARRLSPRVKATLYRLRARIISRGLSRNTAFEPAIEYKLASASMSIVVPIHDAPIVTLRALKSLERDAPMSEVILVDDGSRMAETARLIQEFSSRNRWSVVRNEEPSGHSAACAAGANRASRPYLCLLNSDTVVTPWCWRAIQEAFEAHPSIGIAGPCTSSSGNEQTLDIAAKCRLFWNDNQICAFAERLAAAPLQPVILELPWISGFALFIRRSLWETLGGFDHNLASYLNEVELCKRVANCGYRTVWVRSTYIHHLGSQTYPKLLRHSEVASALLPGLQYIRHRHNWTPCINTGHTKIVKRRDGTWALPSDPGVAHG